MTATLTHKDQALEQAIADGQKRPQDLADQQEVATQQRHGEPKQLCDTPEVGLITKFADQESKLNAIKDHVACEVYQDQLRAERHFVHEHPSTMDSWAHNEIEKLLPDDRVGTITADACSV